MDPQVFAGSFLAQTTVVRRSRFCLLLVIATNVEDAHIIAKQVKHADLPAVVPAVPPSFESAPIKIIPKEDPATSATLISKLVDAALTRPVSRRALLSWRSSAWHHVTVPATALRSQPASTLAALRTWARDDSS